MKRIMNKRSAIALIVSIVGLGAMGAGSASAPDRHMTRTFSFIAKPNSGSGKAIVNIDGLLINARCNAAGEPVIYAFSSADADLFGRVFDGYGRLNEHQAERLRQGQPRRPPVGQPR